MAARGRNGGLMTLHRHGATHFGALNGGKGFNVYGDTDAARSIRAQDMRAKRGMTDRQWEALMRRRAAQFDVPIERLIPRLREQSV